MKKKKINISDISVFASVSFIVYFINVFENVNEFSKSVSFPIFTKTGNSEISVPHFWFVIILFHLILAIRLYIHAWFVEEAFLFKISFNKQKIFRKALDWSLRFLWVLLASYLPSIFPKILPKLHKNIGTKLELYYLLIFILLFLWDIMNYKNIIAFFSKYQKRGEYNDLIKKRINFKITWIFFDFLLLLISLVFSSFCFKWEGEWINWRLLIYFFGMSIIIGLCLTQIIIWAPEIIRSISKKK